ncbi:hypothetical protein BT96DRAFT_1006811 [Gymnopus androsaceus JB14]|uniref:Uncharacterized protein n=1 Tax=Gymnopus androsaceus JB14 TaxID=1447944 RepID=A0A6A4GC08_9AGAR|nr:hypothetical protein BT96DRAFT_1009836 [Gymnopus androsaceus JB14]KAE9385684.1 hypothetical protein BT96DRAFT_1006811 [Gymnopus androsaceus JB14]
MDCTSTLYLARSNNCSIDVSVGDPFPNLSCACKSTIMGSMMELLVKNVVAARTLGVCVVQEECPPRSPVPNLNLDFRKETLTLRSVGGIGGVATHKNLETVAEDGFL